MAPLERIPVDRFPEAPTDDYDHLRSKLRTGDILLCSGEGTFSKLIQEFTDSCWSHVALILRVDSIERVMVIESVEPLGVRTVPLSDYAHHYPGRCVIGRHSLFPWREKTALNKMSQFALDLMGRPYDKGEIAKIAARIARSKLPLSGRFMKQSDIERDDEYICSEYAYECYDSISCPIEYDNRGFIAPMHFAGDQHVGLLGILR